MKADRLLLTLALLALPATASPGENDPRAALTRVFAEPERIPQDRRLGPPRRVSEGNDFKPFTDKSAWQARVRHLREQSLVAAGLWPLPARCPLQATVTGVIDGGDYTVENLYFSSYPGFYVTASLFRPKGKGPFPAVLCAHGHARLGRLASGQKGADTWPYQARGAGFARLGCIALLYDMVGYADSQQLRHPTDAPKVRVREGTDDFEGLEFEMYCLSTLGLQTWNSMRAVDYLLSRPDVDPKRIAITGGSGGATQTLMLMATDDRIAAAAPVCMVSTGFQGDCTCEQAALGKIGTDTVELSAAFAPRPLLVVGATGDWTKEIIEKGGPEIRTSYALAGAADRAEIVRFEAPHNYNRQSREAVYTWLNRVFQLGHTEPIREQPFEAIPPARLSVYSVQHPRPADALDAVGLKRFLIDAARQHMEALRPVDDAKRQEFRRVVGTALRHMVATEWPRPEQIRAEALGTVERKDFRAERLLLARAGCGEQVPALLFVPKTMSSEAVVLVHPQGKAGLITKDGEPGPLLAGLLARGRAVLVPDVFLTGEYHRPGKATAAPDPKTGFFACFNRTLLAQRVHDVLTAVAYLRGRTGVQGVSLVGLEEAGSWCLLARGLCGDAVKRTAVDVGGRSFRNVSTVEDSLYLPGALRYGDLPALAALSAPGEVFLTRTGDFDTSWLRAAYGAAGAERLRLVDGAAPAEQIVAWLTR
jgi:dienelactone hydrolase